MLASRALLVKQVAAVLTKQPVCLAHQSGDWGNWGNTNIAVHVTHEVQVDEKNKVISTPTFMWETDYHYHYIFDGIGSMVKHVMRMTASK
ncbi:UNVERIFIED_CONTAM: hypothetical protein FKN15_009527 [Acipenser sinensis]